MLKLIQVGANKRINIDNINAVIDYGRRMEIQMVGSLIEIKDNEWLEKTRAILEQHYEEVKPIEPELPFQKEMNYFASKLEKKPQDDDTQEDEFYAVDPIEKAVNETLCSTFHVCNDQTKDESECVSGCDFDCYRLPTEAVENLADEKDTTKTT